MARVITCSASANERPADVEFIGGDRSDPHRTFADAKAEGRVRSRVDAFMRDEVIPVLQEYSPVDTGDFRDSWEVTHAEAGVGRVGSTSTSRT